MRMAVRRNDLIVDPSDVFSDDTILPNQFAPPLQRTTGEARLAFAILLDAAEVASGKKPAYGELPALEAPDLRRLRKTSPAERLRLSEKRWERRQQKARIDALRFLAGAADDVETFWSDFWISLAGMADQADAIRERARAMLDEMGEEIAPDMA